MANNDTCLSCGKVLATNEKFCGGCGAYNPNFAETKSKTPIKNDIRPALFVEMQSLIKKTDTNKRHVPMSHSELANMLKTFEKSKGADYNNAKNILLEKLPIEAIEPLWKMKDKIFLGEEVEKDIYQVLGEIGTEEVVKLVIKEFPYGSHTFELLLILSKNQSALAIDWLGEVSGQTDEFPSNILAMLNLLELNNPAAIKALVSNQQLNFLEFDTNDVDYRNRPQNQTFVEMLLSNDDRNRPKNQSFGGSLLSAAIKGVSQYGKQQQENIIAAGLATFPDLPMEIFGVTPSKLILHQQSEMCRLFAVLTLCKNFGFSYLNDCWPASGRNSELSLRSFLAGCYLFSGQSNPNLDKVFTDLLASQLNTPEQYSSAIFICDALMKAKNNFHQQVFTPRIIEFLNKKSIPVKNSIAASTLFTNFAPLMHEALETARVSGLIFVPSLVFASSIYGNEKASALLNQMSSSGKKDVRDAIDNWQSILHS